MSPVALGAWLRMGLQKDVTRDCMLGIRNNIELLIRQLTRCQKGSKVLGNEKVLLA